MIFVVIILKICVLLKCFFLSGVYVINLYLCNYKECCVLIYIMYNSMIGLIKFYKII